jgi:hypothetical protein
VFAFQRDRRPLQLGTALQSTALSPHDRQTLQCLLMTLTVNEPDLRHQTYVSLLGPPLEANLQRTSAEEAIFLPVGKAREKLNFILQ